MASTQTYNIYYPDDYTQKADIPSEMQTLATSVDTALGLLPTGSDYDNSSITLNSQSKIQTVGVIDNNSGNTDKIWTGTLAQYNALATKDSDTFYYITDDDATSTLRSKVEVITSSDTSYTIANLTANKSYKLSELTALTITACETFDEESVIYFESGSTATSISLPDTLANIGDVPDLTTASNVSTGTCNANTKYIISILNNIAVWKAY